MQSCFHKILFKFKYSFDISERSVNFQRTFWFLQFFQKTNKNKWTWGIIVVKLNSFDRFLEEFDDPKNNFEINWPLAANAAGPGISGNRKGLS